MNYKCHFCEHEHGPLAEQSEMCSQCHDFSMFQVKKRMSQRAQCQFKKLIHEEEQIANQNIVFDRDTALMILKDLTAHMRPSQDLFGNRTLVINRDGFELIRKKYLGNKGESK